MSTNSSAAVGWTASVRSKSRLVAPQVSATARLCTISGRIGAEHVDAQHAIADAVDHQLHVGARRFARERGLHRPEIRLVDIDRTLCRCVGLGQADGGDRRIGEHRAGDGSMIDPRRTPTEFGVGEGAALGDGHRRQVDAVGHVANGPYAGRRGAAVGIDDHRALVVQRRADRVETQAGGIRMPAGRVEHGGGGERRAVGALQRETCAGTPQRRQRNAAGKRHPALFQRAGESAAQVFVETAQRQGGAIGQRHPRTESGQDARELDGDVPAAQHQQRLRDLAQIEHLVRRHRVFETRQRRGGRAAAGGDQDPRSPVAAAGNLDAVLAGQARLSGDQFDAGPGQQVAVDPLQPVNFRALASAQRDISNWPPIPVQP